MSNKKKPRAATEAPTHNQQHDHSNVLGPVDKLKFLCIAAADASLSRCDLASLMTIANGANSKTGVTWRSSNTLAKETASASRTVKRSVKKLVEKGYIAIVRRGNSGGKANTYSLGKIDVLANGVADVTTINSLVPPVSTSSDVGVTSHVPQMSPLSMTLSEPKARIERNRSSEGDASPCGVARAPSGKRQTNGDMYPDFWDAFPFRAGVSSAEEMLEKIIKSGVGYEMILAGATRYAAYCKKSKIRTSADAWLRRQSWRDEWTPYVDKKESEVSKKTHPKKIEKKLSEKPRVGIASSNQRYEAWKVTEERYAEIRQNKFEELKEHIGFNVQTQAKKCDACYQAIGSQQNTYCETGMKFWLAYDQLGDQLLEHRRARPENIKVT